QETVEPRDVHIEHSQLRCTPPQMVEMETQRERAARFRLPFRFKQLNSRANPSKVQEEFSCHAVCSRASTKLETWTRSRSPAVNSGHGCSLEPGSTAAFPKWLGV